MDIVEATDDYERWLAGFGPLHAGDLAEKHRLLRGENPFAYFRATYYRWAQRRANFGADWTNAPAVPSVGDLHLENFGTWRDAEGRLCWGINDFDEAGDLPYTNDLVRLAASVRAARDAGIIDVKLNVACAAILAGYRRSLELGGTPFVLEERHAELRTLAMTREREPGKFWKKLAAELSPTGGPVPVAVRLLLNESLPADADSATIGFRTKVGAGSLGKSRYVALATWAGAFLAREAKRLTPSADVWLGGEPAESQARRIVASAIRSPDPFLAFHDGWIVRRLAPRSSRIELKFLKPTTDLEWVLTAMGGETANVHLGRRECAAPVLADLSSRPHDWLQQAVRTASRDLDADRRDWRARR